MEAAAEDDDHGDLSLDDFEFEEKLCLERAPVLPSKKEHESNREFLENFFEVRKASEKSNSISAFLRYNQLQFWYLM